MRERAALAALLVLEEHLKDFSSVVITGFGGRSRVARWMCMQSQALGGGNAYQVITDGEADRLWEEVTRACGLPG